MAESTKQRCGARTGDGGACSNPVRSSTGRCAAGHTPRVSVATAAAASDAETFATDAGPFDTPNADAAPAAQTGDRVDLADGSWVVVTNDSGDDPLVRERCRRCNGAGRLIQYRLEGGRCFDCLGDKYDRKERPLSEAQRRSRRRVTDRQRRERKRREDTEARAQAAHEARDRWEAENPDLSRALAEHVDSNSAGFLREMRQTVVERGGTLTPKQTEVAQRIMVEEAEKRAYREAEHAAAKPVPEGKKVPVEGHVVKTGTTYTQWGVRDTMIVKGDDGWRVHMTRPRSLRDVEAGERVRLTADITASDDDDRFGFGKRPAGAEVVKEPDGDRAAV